MHIIDQGSGFYYQQITALAVINDAQDEPPEQSL